MRSTDGFSIEFFSRDGRVADSDFGALVGWDGMREVIWGAQNGLDDSKWIDQARFVCSASIVLCFRNN